MGLPTNPKLSDGHLTLCRLVEPKDVSDITNIKIRPVRFYVSRFAIYRSEPELGFQNYEELASFSLEETM